MKIKMDNKILSPKEWVDNTHKEYIIREITDMMQQYADYVARERGVGFAQWLNIDGWEAYLQDC
ncbi:hypothetical protein UFOVP74_52 [uncultured Caudovirales phage]|uniref:Uncharacterized protein n=1 Tax=uncultured Caudovirales phage TaxID=2100421 RepID=A0A6J5KVG2_9CAUD|nr:hypothetical protein UFOVP74_52 [uncultured Caudovirales phage]